MTEAEREERMGGLAEVEEVADMLAGQVFGKVVMARVLLGPIVDGEKDWQVVRRKTM